MNRDTAAPHPSLVIDHATADDAPAIKAMVDAAYSKYIERMNDLPAPMKADYRELAATGNLYALRDEGGMRGAVLLSIEPDSVKVSNLVVDPQSQGKGYGRALMEFAEQLAHRLNLPALTLFTNIHMRENIALYTKTGFIETGRKTELGYERIYFRKALTR